MDLAHTKDLAPYNRSVRMRALERHGCTAIESWTSPALFERRAHLEIWRDSYNQSPRQPQWHVRCPKGAPGHTKELISGPDLRLRHSRELYQAVKAS